MADKWEAQLMDFLKRAGDELKRTGEELRNETQRILEEVKDPVRQAKVKESLKDFTSWAKQTGKDAATLIDTTVQKVESAIERGATRAKGGASAGAARPTRKAAGKASPAPKSAGRTAARKSPARKAAGKAAAKKAGARRKPSQP